MGFAILDFESILRDETMQGKDNSSRRNGTRQRFPWEDGIHQFPRTVEEIEASSVEELDRAIEMVRNWQAQKLQEMLQVRRLRLEQDVVPNNILLAAHLRVEKAKKEQRRIQKQVNGRFSSFLSMMAEALLLGWIFSPQSGYERALAKYNEAVRRIDDGDSAGNFGKAPILRTESGPAADAKNLQGDMERVGGDMWIALLREVRRQKVSGAYNTQLA